MGKSKNFTDEQTELQFASVLSRCCQVLISLKLNYGLEVGKKKAHTAICWRSSFLPPHSSCPAHFNNFSFYPITRQKTAWRLYTWTEWKKLREEEMS